MLLLGEEETRTAAVPLLPGEEEDAAAGGVSAPLLPPGSDRWGGAARLPSRRQLPGRRLARPQLTAV
jgi:hypothetical protein